MRQAPIGVPFVSGILSQGSRGLELLKDCPQCGETIACRERKDDESFTGREFASHYLAHDGWRLVDACDACGSDDGFIYPKIAETGRGVYCAGCVGAESDNAN